MSASLLFSHAWGVINIIYSPLRIKFRVFKMMDGRESALLLDLQEQWKIITALLCIVILGTIHNRREADQKSKEACHLFKQRFPTAPFLLLSPSLF